MFQEGDYIRMKGSCSGAYVGRRYILERKNDGKLYAGDYCFCQHLWELEARGNTTMMEARYLYSNLNESQIQGGLQIKETEKKSMSKISNMMKRLLDADTQSLVKAGYINGDLNLTEEGRNALWSIIFSEKKAELVTMAQEVIAEEAKK